MDEKTTLARELARTFHSFRRHGHGGQKHFDTKIKKSEYFLLGTIMDLQEGSPRGIKLSDLSQYLQITPAAVTQMINSLEDHGYVCKLTDPDDRRIVLVQPTGKGREIVKEKKRRFLQHFEDLVGYLGKEDSQELIRILGRAFEFFNEQRDS